MHHLSVRTLSRLARVTQGSGSQSLRRFPHTPSPPTSSRARLLCGLCGGGTLLYISSGLCRTPITGRLRIIHQSRTSEEEGGKKVYSDILSSTPIQCGSSCDTRLVHGITRRLARAAKAATDGSTDGFKWCVAVANSDEVNAMCAPGGRIIITTGLLDLLSRNTEEVAIVLGHEISHAVCRHAAEGRFIRRLMMLLTSALQIIIGGGIGWNSGFTLGVVLPYSRKLELEADYIGTLLCADAGYNPQAAVSVFRKLEQASGEPDVWGRKFFSTHPLGDVRLKNVHSWLPFCVQRYHASPHVAHTIDTHPHTRGA